MDNSLQKYIGRNDLTKAIASLEVIQGKSKSTGNPYVALKLTFVNGYSKILLPMGAENFAYTNAFDLIPSQETIDSAF